MKNASIGDMLTCDPLLFLRRGASSPSCTSSVVALVLEVDNSSGHPVATCSHFRSWDMSRCERRMFWVEDLDLLGHATDSGE